MHSKAKSSYVDYKQSFSQFLTFLQAQKVQTLSLNVVVRWIRALWDAGRSPSTAIKAISFLDTLYVVLRPNSFSSYMKAATVSFYIKSWEESWKRKGKSTRQFISWEEAKKISQIPPPNVDHFKWKCYILFAWCFMLRHGEIRSVKPENVQYIAEADNWEIFLGECKTAKEVGRGQTARFPARLLPTEVKELLTIFAKLPAGFSWGVNKNKVSTHIRKVLNTQDRGYVFHSLRHGRATHLRRFKNINDQDLKMFGRWESVDALYCYLHC